MVQLECESNGEARLSQIICFVVGCAAVPLTAALERWRSREAQSMGSRLSRERASCKSKFMRAEKGLLLLLLLAPPQPSRCATSPTPLYVALQRSPLLLYSHSTVCITQRLILCHHSRTRQCSTVCAKQRNSSECEGGCAPLTAVRISDCCSLLFFTVSYCFVYYSIVLILIVFTAICTAVPFCVWTGRPRNAAHVPNSSRPIFYCFRLLLPLSLSP